MLEKRKRQMHTDPFRDYVITDHATFEMKRRGISIELVQRVLENPEQRLAIRKGREVFQSRIHMGEKHYVVRVFVDIDRTPPEVVTVYRTSKIDKYWEKNQ